MKTLFKYIFFCYSTSLFANDYIEAVHNIKNWEKKIHQSTRAHLLKDNFLEAWRVTQLARITATKLSDVDYIIALSATRSSVCPLGFVSEEKWRDQLLYAYAFRFAQRFSGESMAKSPYDQVDHKGLVSQLNNHQVFHLEDIPKAKLILRSGCGWMKSKFKDKKVAAQHEYQHLITWYHYFKDIPDEKKSAGYQNVIFRILTLSEKHGDEADKEMLRHYYGAFKDEHWLGLEEPERSLLWQMMPKIDESLTIPLPQKHAKEQLVIKIILHSRHKEASNWLGAIDFNSLPVKMQLMLVDHLLSIENIQKKNWLLNQKMILEYKLGNTDNVLRLMRSLTVDDEAHGESLINDNAIYIASQMFAEYQFDQKLLGTIQSSVPSSYWTFIYKNMLLTHALAGNSQGFSSILGSLTENKKINRLQIKPFQMELLQAILARNLTQFQKLVDSTQSRKILVKETLQLFDQLAGEVFSFSENKRRLLNPFMQSMGNYAQKHIKKENDLKKLEFLLSLFDQNNQIDWNIGSTTTRQGSQILGTVHLSDSQLQESKFKWQDIQELPRRNLVAVPDSKEGFGWIIR